MAVIGNKPAQSFNTIRKQTFTGTGDSAYSLDYSVSGPNDLEVFVNNVRQEPTVAYNAASQTLTMSEGIDSTDDFYAIYKAQAYGTTTLPVDQPITVAGATINGTTSFAGNVSLDSSYTLSAPTAGQIRVPGQVIQHKIYHYTNDGPNSSQHTSVTTPGTGVGTGASSWGRANAIETTTQTPTASEFQVDITPKYSNSLIKIDFTFYANPRGAGNSPGIRIVRTISGGTPTVVWQPPTNTTSAFGMSYMPQETDHHVIKHFTAFDQPSSTSSINYRVYYYNYSSGSSVMYFCYNADNHWAPPQALIVTEITQ